ncbi:MAG: peptidase, partial [Acidobacteria bacterium]|nr:peptidase [Acidobacteriota bacterium]
MRIHCSIRILLLSIVTTCVLHGACVKNPVTGKRQLALMSESQEIAMGQASHPEVLSEFGAVDNAELQQYFSRIGNQLAKVSHRPNLPWQFTVVDSPVVNAFAVPGGYIYLTRGILEYMNNEAEMAGVLGHEIGHVTARHSVTQISQGQLINLGLGMGSIFSRRFQQLGGLAQIGLEVLMLKYSRDHERESDLLGLEYMAKCGYDPEQMSTFFQVFVHMREESGQSIPNWLSSHPAPPDRIKRASEEGARIKSTSGRRDYITNAEQFLPKLDNLIYGENPREGFVEKNRFVHPDLRFQMDVPSGWKVENTKSVVTFAEPEGRAIVQLSMVPPEAGRTPGEVAQTISRRQGTQFISGGAEPINGNQAYLGLYRVQSEGGNIGVTAAIISFGNRLYQIAGLAPENSFSQYSRPLNAVLRSFRELTDSKLLAAQPDRM